jgi:hypothetical protein
MNQISEINFPPFRQASSMKISTLNLDNMAWKVEVLDALEGLAKDGSYMAKDRLLKGKHWADVKMKRKSMKRLKHVHIEVCRNNTLRIYLWRHLKGAI